MNPKQPFKWRHFQKEIILLNVRWYLRYPLSYRNLEEMMLERGLKIEIMHMINKGQVEGVSKKDVLAQKKFVESLFGIAV